MLENMSSQNKKLASGVALIISVIFSVSSQIPNSSADNQLVKSDLIKSYNPGRL